MYLLYFRCLPACLSVCHGLGHSEPADFLVSVALSVLSMELWLLHTNSAGAVVVVAHHMGPGPKKATAKKTSHHAAAD